MRIATGFLHGVPPLHGRPPSMLTAGIAILLVMLMLGLVVLISALQPRRAGGGGWWRRFPEDSPSPWRPIPGLGSSPWPRRTGLRSSICPSGPVETARPAAPSRSTITVRA